MNKTVVSTCMLALLLSTVSACGWHLRGSTGNTANANFNFDRIHISAQNQRSDTVRQLNRQLRASGVTLTDSAADASYRLVIMKERSDRRTATVSGSARISELSLTETVEFTVLDTDGNPVIPPSLLKVERIFEYDEHNVLATADESRMLKREMRADLAGQIYNRLRRLKKPAATSNAPAS